MMVIHKMIDLKRITGFDWDDGNARKNDKHGVSQSEAEEVFFRQPLLLLVDHRHAHEEPRFHALGHTGEGRRLHVTFALRASGSLICVISARDMHRKERVVYDQAP
jgi:uncharacterized DUF497 family protein